MFRHHSIVIRQIVAVALFCCSITSGANSSAQISADQVYADAKDVITELIEREVAESIAANLACISPDGLLKYFPETLQAVHDRNFGSLKDVMQREVVALTGNYLYQSFKEGRSITLAEFLPTKAFKLDGKTKTCAERIRDIGGPERRRAELENDARKLTGVYLPLDACLEGRATRVDVACALAKAAMATISGRPESAKEAIARAVASGAVSTLPGASEGELRDFRRALVDELTLRLLGGSFPAQGIFASFVGGSTEASASNAAWGDLDAAIGFSYGSMESLAAIADVETRISAMALRSIFDRDVPAVHLVLDGKERSNDLLRGMAVQLGVGVAGEPRASSVVRTLLGNVGITRLGRVEVTKAESGAIVVNHVADELSGISGNGVQTLETLFDVAQRKRQFLAMLGLPAEAPKVAREALRGLIGVVQVLHTTTVAFHDAGRRNGDFDLLVMLGAILDGRLDDELCRKDAPELTNTALTPPAPGTPTMNVSACALWKQLGGLLDPRGDIRPILLAARDGNHRALATAAVSAIFSTSVVDEVCCEKNADCYETARLYGRFAKSFVAYVLASKEDEDGSLGARAAFKSAAVDVIRSVGKRGGVERSVGVRGILIPSFSLRASWSRGYEIRPSDDRVRYVPTVDWPTFRLPLTTQESPVYLAAALTLLDPLAPLAELISQDANASYRDTDWIAAMAIQPRLGGVLAVPPLSKNLAVGLAVSFRGAAPVDVTSMGQQPEDAAEQGYRVRYGSFLQGDPLRDMLEVSAAIQYIP